MPIPPDPSLVGQLFASQAILLDGVNPFGGVVSNAALLAVGDIPPLTEPTFLTLTSPIKAGDALFDQMAGSPLTAEFAAAVSIEGFGTMGFEDAFELKLVGDTGMLGPVPPRPAGRRRWECGLASGSRCPKSRVWSRDSAEPDRACTRRRRRRRCPSL